jgi:hypothetical protein
VPRELGIGMTRTFDPVRFDAFTRLLARPDPRGLPSRRHVIRCQGEPERRGTRLPGIIMAWMQRRHLEIDIEETSAPATCDPRRHKDPAANPGLRVLRPTA